MSPQPDHKPITEADLLAMESKLGRCDDATGCLICVPQRRLIAEVRRLREALGMYGMPAHWGSDAAGGIHDQVWEPPTPDLRNEPGWVLARKALGWGEPSEPCENPSCDGAKELNGHRCFKDGRWLDTNEEM